MPVLPPQTVSSRAQNQTGDPAWEQHEGVRRVGEE